MPKVRDKSREADEIMLRMVRRRAAGWKLWQVQTAYAPNLSSENVGTITDRILLADIEECAKLWPGDDPASLESKDAVLAGYWPRRTRRVA